MLMARKSQDLQTGQYGCEPAGDWVPACEHLLRAGLERQGNPLEGTYVLDVGSGIFIRTDAAGGSTRLGKDALSLPIAIFDLYSEQDCGEYPSHAGSKLIAFWRAACD